MSYNNQLPVVKQYFTIIIIKRGGITTNLTLRNHVTDVPKYHNAGIWSTDQKILRFMFKTYSSSSSLVIISCWFATSRLVAPVSVRLVYYNRNVMPPLWRHCSANSYFCIFSLCILHSEQEWVIISESIILSSDGTTLDTYTKLENYSYIQWNLSITTT